MEFILQENYRNACGIYAITCVQNGKVYVGQTKERFERRYWHHRWHLENGSHHNTHLQRAWNKYGDNNFTFSVLEVCDECDLNDAECRHIAAFVKCGKSFNMSAGGAGKSCPMPESAKRIVGEKNRQHMLGRKASEATKKKMRQSSRHISPTEEHRQKLREAMSNRVVAQETRQKLSLANAGEKSRWAKLNDLQAAEIKQKLMNGMLMREVADQYPVSLSAISAIAAGRTFTNVTVPGWEEYLVERKLKNAKKK